MFPIFTRVFWLLVQPVSLVALFVLLGLLLGFRKGRWWGRVFTLLALLVLCTMAFTTFGYVLITPLENRFVRPAEPAHIDGIVVLGGGMDGEVDTARKIWELNRSGDRLVETLRLALAHPEAKIVVAAGRAALALDEEPETEGAKRFFAAFGIAPERLVFDDQSRNTQENAQFAKDLAGNVSGQTWLLVTSAFHMPRSVGLFRKADFPVIPWPTDYFASGVEGVRLKPDQSPENIAVSSIALREWIGLLGYRMTGRIDDVFPGP
jgi:uncharacterized SAM-binding protein YcdF (DUF218 family)